MSKPLPSWAELGRRGWQHRGQARPPFAIEPGPGQESVWDYPRPPRIVSDSREVVVRVDAIEIARTSRALRVLETSHPPTFYLPREDVAMQHLAAAGQGSRCEWKGEASYFDVIVGKERVVRAAWSYEDPFDDAAVLAGHLCFYASLVEAYVAGERARPFKGDPGSSGW